LGKPGRRFRRKFARIRHAVWAIAVAAVAIAGLVLTIKLFIDVWRWRRQAVEIRDVKDRISTENEIAKNLLQAFGGAFLLAGLYFTWKNLYVAQEGQLTDRFNQAVEHLGSDKLEIRLGGIYAMARIARDSEKDYWAVVQVFSAYIREVSHRTSAFALAIDVQAMLTLLGQRAVEYEGPEEVIDLAGADLHGAKLRRALFERACFDDANLEGADLSGAQLGGALLRNANMRGAYIRDADLEDTDLTGADLRDASLRNSRLGRANIAAAKLEGASLIGADLSETRNALRSQIESAITDETTRLPSYSDISAV
jgi:hypothetical protein